MKFGQQTQKAMCKDCEKDFDSKQVFGQFTKRCDACKVAKGTKMQVVIKNTSTFDPSYGLNKLCGGGGQHELNPGGYCNHCRAGGDYS